MVLFLSCALSFLISYRHLADPRPILEALLHPQITNLPGHIQAVFVQNIVKLYASILVKAEAEVIWHVYVCTCNDYCHTMYNHHYNYIGGKLWN